MYLDHACGNQPTGHVTSMQQNNAYNILYRMICEKETRKCNEVHREEINT